MLGLNDRESRKHRLEKTVYFVAFEDCLQVSTIFSTTVSVKAVHESI